MNGPDPESQDREMELVYPGMSQTDLPTLTSVLIMH